jgi:hypothetical protein
MTDMIPRAEADARVAAACEAAANLHDETFCDKRATKAYWQSDAIRALTPDDARAALEAMLAEARMEGYRDGWRFAYRQSEATGSVPDPDHAAIRAEAEE